MMKCKVAIDDKNECTNCCYFCDKKDTCNDVCQDIAKVCEEQVEETDLQVIQSAVPDVLKAITDITVQKKKLDEQEKVMKQKLQEAMETYGVKSFETPEVKFMYSLIEKWYKKYGGVASKYLNRYAALFVLAREYSGCDVQEILLSIKKRMHQTTDFFRIVDMKSEDVFIY